MANYTVSHYEKNNGTWVGAVTVTMPDIPNCVDRKVVKFEAASEQELDGLMTDYIVTIKNNLTD